MGSDEKKFTSRNGKWQSKKTGKAVYRGAYVTTGSGKKKERLFALHGKTTRGVKEIHFISHEAAKKAGWKRLK